MSFQTPYWVERNRQKQVEAVVKKRLDAEQRLNDSNPLKAARELRKVLVIDPLIVAYRAFWKQRDAMPYDEHAVTHLRQELDAMIAATCVACRCFAQGERRQLCRKHYQDPRAEE